MVEDKPYIQYYHLRGRPVFRSVTKPTLHPSPAQLESQRRFAEAARKAKGMKKTGELSPAAELIKQTAKGPVAPPTRKEKVWEKDLREYADKRRMSPEEIDEAVDRVVEMLS